MLGFSYGEVLLLLGATAAVIGPKDLPIIARTVGRLAGRSIGYVQMARGQFQSIAQQNQALQVHKDLQETMSQLEAIRHEVRSLSLLNSGPVMTRLVDNIAGQPPVPEANKESSNHPLNSTVKVEATKTTSITKDHSSAPLSLTDIHSQASTYARLAESPDSMNELLNELKDESGQFVILPISAESAKLLPARKGNLCGSDILLEAVLEENVAHNAKDFFSQPQSMKE